MSFKGWWHDRTLTSKAIVVFCALLILQVGLCFSTPYTLQPTLDLVAGSVDQVGLLIWQALLCGVTILLLVLLIITRVISTLTDRGPQSSVVPHDSDSDPTKKR